MRSKDDEQLHGEIKKTLSSNCKDPYRTRAVQIENDSLTFKIAPCGAIANSLFNGIFTVIQLLKGGTPNALLERLWGKGGGISVVE